MSEQHHTSNSTGSNGSVKDWYQKNKVVAIIVVLAVIAAIFYALTQGGSNGSNTQGNSAPANDDKVVAGVANTATEEPSPGSSDTLTADPSQSAILSADGHEQAPEVKTDWRPVAEDFAKAYGNPEGGRDAWLARLKPLVNEETYQGFESTDFDHFIKAQSFDRLGEPYADGSIIQTYVFFEGSTEPGATITLEPLGENQEYIVTNVA